MNQIARWNADDRRDLFHETADRRHLSAVIVEKDFWVCRTLRQLFDLEGLRDHLVFKGGTSLSKVFGAIERFSEDIDISIDEAYLGIEPANTALSKTQRQKRCDRIGRSCGQAVGSSFRPLLERRLTELLGGPPSTASWSILPDEHDAATLIFQYPTAVGRMLAYIRPAVRLEMGSGVDPWPNVERRIQPIAAEEFPDLFTTPSADVVCLDIVRTFWEKATILHMLNTRVSARDVASKSRHFYDLATMLSHPDLADPLARLDILRRTADHKASYFPTAGVSYADCYSGRLRLVPTNDRLPPIAADYAAMRDMFFGAVTPFEKIVGRLGELERLVNDARPPTELGEIPQGPIS